MAQISLNVNAKTRTANAPPGARLLYALRDHLELHGPQLGMPSLTRWERCCGRCPLPRRAVQLGQMHKCHAL